MPREESDAVLCPFWSDLVDSFSAGKFCDCESCRSATTVRRAQSDAKQRNINQRNCAFLILVMDTARARAAKQCRGCHLDVSHSTCLLATGNPYALTLAKTSYIYVAIVQSLTDPLSRYQRKCRCSSRQNSISSLEQRWLELHTPGQIIRTSNQSGNRLP